MLGAGVVKSQGMVSGRGARVWGPGHSMAAVPAEAVASGRPTKPLRWGF